ncbi:MAG: argininosuccinate synthase [Candidatus Anstonellaceae archaeon]
MALTLEEKAKVLAKEHAGVKKIALSFSGGLDSAVVGMLLQEAGFSILPVTVNIGQHSDFSQIAKNAKKMFGASVVADFRDDFSANVFRAIKANFGLDGNMSTGGLSRPSFARALSEAARKGKCQAIAHGSSGTGNDHLTMENSLRVLAPDMRIIAPVRDLDMRRDEALEYARKNNLPTNMERAQHYSVDENLLARTIRQGAALDPGHSLPEDAYKWTVSPQNAPNVPANVSIEFENGMPKAISIEGKKFADGPSMIEKLNEIGGKHGVGRVDWLDDKVVGLKIREVYECPGARMLLKAHRELESITLTTKELDVKGYIDGLWNRLVHDGGWHTRLRRGLDAFIDETQRAVDGVVDLQLYKGSIVVKGRKSKHALYDTRLSGRGKDAMFSQKEARYFAKLYGMQDVIAYVMDVDS